jgi:hypothetical protein
MKPLGTNAEQYDTIIQHLKQACHQVEQAIGASAGIAFDLNNPTFKRHKPKRLWDVYDGLSDLLGKTQKERSQLES